MKVSDIANILACTAYVGLVEASTLGYHELMFPQAQTLRNIIQHQGLQFPVSVAEISLLEATCTAHWSPAEAMKTLSGLLASPDLPPHLRTVCEQHVTAMQNRSQTDEWRPSTGPGFGRLAGGHLPTGYKRHAKTSVLTNELIRGPAFELENNKLHVSLAEALAWVRVNAFSPLNTGCKICPV